METKIQATKYVENILNKCVIIHLFNTNVKGKLPTNTSLHDGSEGHNLERLMGLKSNSKNEPDLLGYEMKTQTKSKITFVDKTPSKKYYKGVVVNKQDKDTKRVFWNTFKRQKSEGTTIGGWKLNKYDNDGQCLKVDDNKNIQVMYLYKNDKRPNKNELIDNYYKNDKPHIIIEWLKKDLQDTIDKKWNQAGFFICKKNKNNIYYKICFGNPINFKYWIEQLEKENIYYDGYSKVDGRWRGCFRASNSWWYSHITEEY